ncbi:hypothetical protein B296_00020204 [Ensete ventricosum]|uniref:Uncharacterized protein n=1 Tax=Ensete ventricosum TaxID=4639 RepID=A0A427AP80_ENSVE|nr:hypothetical protein B296_00020204 [Ensete ventricosum]
MRLWQRGQQRQGRRQRRREERPVGGSSMVATSLLVLQREGVGSNGGRGLGGDCCERNNGAALERSDGSTVGSSGRDGRGGRLLRQGRKKGAADEGGEEEGATVTGEGTAEEEVAAAARATVGEVGGDHKGRKVRMRMRLRLGGIGTDAAGDKARGGDDGILHHGNLQLLHRPLHPSRSPSPFALPIGIRRNRTATLPRSFGSDQIRHIIRCASTASSRPNTIRLTCVPRPSVDKTGQLGAWPCCVRVSISLVFVF